MSTQIIELNENTVNAVMKILEAHKDKQLSLMGSCGPIYIHITDDCIILDEIALE